MKPDEIKSNLVAVGNCINFEALEYINELETENKQLNKKVEELSEVLSDSIKIKVKEIKSEAVKEFAVRLKGNFTEQFCGQKYDLIHGWIDNLLKEMVGEK